MESGTEVTIVPSIDTRLRRSFRKVVECDCWLLAVVPFVTALLQIDKILEVVAYRGFSVGIALGLPLPVSSVWKFVSVPTSGATVTGPDTVTGIVAVAIGLLVQGILTAGYLGSLRNALAGSDWAFLASVRRYFVSFLGFGLLLVALFVPPFGLALAGGPIVLILVVWVPLLFLVGYLVYAAPFLVVLNDEPLVASLRESLSLSTSEGAYFRYAVGYALLVAGVSLPATIITVNAGIVGVLFGAVALAPVSLVFDAMTLRFVSDLTTDGDDVPESPPVDDEGPEMVEPTGSIDE